MSLVLETQECLCIRNDRYVIASNPQVPEFAHAQEGRTAIVYRVIHIDSGHPHALKVFKPAYRAQCIQQHSFMLSNYSSLPGLKACDRLILNHQMDEELIAIHKDLEYAILMPWIPGENWSSIILRRYGLSHNDSILLAYNTSRILSELESRHLAHCDCAGDNVLINLSSHRVELVDLENMYGSGFSRPPILTIGSYGYHHRNKNWCAESDRFSGAVLLAEMLIWHDPEVRDIAYGETFFAPEEVQNHTKRFEVMTEVLSKISSDFASLFKEAWFSQTLSDCPELAPWFHVLSELANRQR